MLRIVTLVLCCVCISGRLPAQHAELSVSRGPVLRIYPDFPASSGSAWAGITYFPAIRDSALWNRAFNYPSPGIRLVFADLGSRVLGETVGLQYVFMKQKKLLRFVDFNWGLGLGTTYFTNPYHYIRNEANIANGGRFAFLMSFELGLNFRISPHLSILTAFSQYHTSNAHTRLPNVGINVPSWKLGFQYFRERPAFEPRPPADSEWAKKWNINGRFSLGMNEFGRSTAPTNGPKQYIYLTSLYFSKRYSPKGYLHLGFDGYYNSGYRSYIVSQEPEKIDDNFLNASALIAFIGHEYVYGHYGLVVQAGYYLHNPFLAYYIEHEQSAESKSIKAKVPGKFGVHYYVRNPYRYPGKNLYIGVYVKSNLSQADFLEMGLGWRF